MAEFLVKMMAYDETLTAYVCFFGEQIDENKLFFFDQGIIQGPSRYRGYISFDPTIDLL